MWCRRNFNNIFFSPTLAIQKSPKSFLLPIRRKYSFRKPPAMTESSQNPLFGLWKPNPALRALYYGDGCVKNYLLTLLPSSNSKSFIITGSSLANKTPVVQEVESLLGPKHHAGTFSKIGQHAPIAELDQATDQVQQDSNIDTIISIGGGSPIDSAKAISYRVHEKSGKYLFHITIPTTLSAAECTPIAGFTQRDGVKTSVFAPELNVSAILYDPHFAAYTPTRLWLSTGLRAMDHAMESMYHPTTTEAPCRWMCQYAASELFTLLPRAKATHPNDPTVITRLFLAAYMSLGFIGLNLKGPLGLSHTLGYALGSPYGIPHGETSCLTLGHVLKLKAAASKEDAEQIARMLQVSGLGGGKDATGDAVKDANVVGDKVLGLVKDLGLYKDLTERGVGKDQADLITSRATGASEGQLYDRVKQLVLGLW